MPIRDFAVLVANGAVNSVTRSAWPRGRNVSMSSPAMAWSLGSQLEAKFFARKASIPAARTRSEALPSTRRMLGPIARCTSVLSSWAVTAGLRSSSKTSFQRVITWRAASSNQPRSPAAGLARPARAIQAEGVPEPGGCFAALTCA